MAAETVPYGRKTQRPSPVAEVHIVWITAGLGCDGDSVSVTAATQPSIEDVLLGARLKTYEFDKSGGGRGIRTPGTVSRTVVFKTTRFNHSRIPPTGRSSVVLKIVYNSRREPLPDKSR
jgi:hypothetical protein